MLWTVGGEIVLKGYLKTDRSPIDDHKIYQREKILSDSSNILNADTSKRHTK